jgi:transcriptional regulator with XRE-family HTH domain
LDHYSTETDTNILAAFGRNLREARVAAGLSQQELAARVGIALTNLTQIESGRSDPSLRLLGTLAKAVGCAAYELVTHWRTPHDGGTMKHLTRTKATPDSKLGRCEKRAKVPD